MAVGDGKRKRRDVYHHVASNKLVIVIFQGDNLTPLAASEGLKGEEFHKDTIEHLYALNDDEMFELFLRKPEQFKRISGYSNNHPFSNENLEKQRNV